MRSRPISQRKRLIAVSIRLHTSGCVQFCGLGVVYSDAACRTNVLFDLIPALADFFQGNSNFVTERRPLTSVVVL